MLFQIIMVKSFTMINAARISQLEARRIVFIRASPILLIISYTININDLQTIHHTIVFYIRNKQIYDIPYLHFLICFFSISNTKVTNTSDVVN